MKCLIVSNTPLPKDNGNNAPAEQSPRKDYLLLAESLGADVLAPSSKPQKGLRSYASSFVQQAWEAFRRRNDYDIVLSMSEQVGLVLALLFKVSRYKKPHVMVNHYLTPTKKSMFVRWFGVDSHIAKFICYGSTQVSYLTGVLGVPAEKVELVLHPADSRFWHPMPVEEENLIFSPGNTARDNETFLKAVDGLDVDVMLTGFSPWVAGDQDHSGVKIPDNVTYKQCTIEEVRDFYAKSRFVVVPLMPVNFQAGTLATYESMAMGKAVITTANGGNIDVVKDGETGYYVPSQDSEALREAITRLLENPDAARRMGAKGHEMVEGGMNLDVYVRQVTQIVREVWEQTTQQIERTSALASNRTAKR